ncbi:MAG: hypothetical protein HKN80_02685, partial [Acidimicrobiia bacterium]|nr:hypothetical protein [Acidimicrobiia bacterium]
MLWPTICLLLFGSLGVGAPEPPTTTTTLPERPAAGLALDAVPPVLPAVTGSKPALPGRPSVPGASPALAALAAGLAVLAARARRITDAEQTMRRALQDSLFSDVGHSDLVTMARTVDRLDTGEASAAVSGLSDGELGVWIRELDGWQGGFDRLEQARLFAVLADRLDARQLARLINHGKATELITAVSANAPPAVAAQLALLLWANRTPADEGWEQIGALLAATPPEIVEATVAAVMPPSLPGDLLGRHPAYSDGPVRLQLDGMAVFLDLAAGFADPQLKAGLFLAFGEQLRLHRREHVVGDVTRGDVLGRLASLVRSDAAAVVTRLNHAADPHGNSTAAWIQDMIEADRFDELDVLLADLIGGRRRLEFFSDPGTDPARPYPNAANLGYYVGAYSLAIDSIADDAADQIHLVAELFSLVTGVVPGPDGSKIRLPFGPLVDMHADSVVDDLRDQSATLKQTLWALAKPRTPDG